MRIGFSQTATFPETLPLVASPLVTVPLVEPPTIEWIGVGQHGRYAREDYRLPELWCLHLYRWTGALCVGETSLPVAPGYVSVIPPNQPLSHYFRTHDPVAIHLSCGFRLASLKESSTVILPMMANSGSFFGALNSQWEKAIGLFASTPRRAESLLWDILWKLAENRGGEPTRENFTSLREPPLITRIRETIELRLAEPLRVAELAQSVDLSHNHLTRLFQSATGKTVVAYIRERRMERATQLLRYTTLPVKRIAAQVGLPDLHQFNKAIRAATGSPPREIRLCLTDSPNG